MEIISPDSYVVGGNNNTNSNRNSNINSNINPSKPDPFKCTNLFIYGAGKMGSSIAAELAIQGLEVSVFDYVEYKIRSLTSRIYEKLEQAVETGLIEKHEEIDTIMARVKIAPNFKEAAKTADIVFECCVDGDSIKKSIFKELDELCPPTTVLSTNSMNVRLSSILPAVKKHPNRVIGTRFLYPVVFIPRVEISHNGDPYCFGVKKMVNFLASIGKKPYFFNGKDREVLLHNEVVAIYEEQIREFKRKGYPKPKSAPLSGVITYSSAPASSAPPPRPPTDSSGIITYSSSHSSDRSYREEVARPSYDLPSPVPKPHAPPPPSPSPSFSPKTSVPPPPPSHTLTTTTTTSSTISASLVAANYEDSKKCVVCMEIDRNSVLVPCGHICACYECAVAVHKNAAKCPICRETITTVVKTFVV